MIIQFFCESANPLNNWIAACAEMTGSTTRKPRPVGGELHISKGYFRHIENFILMFTIKQFEG
jgi:hypothetical protein